MSDRDYFRPIAQTDLHRTKDACALAAGPVWFDRVERLRRGKPGQLISASDVPPDILARLCAPRAPVAGLSMDAPRLMGILNLTPDSFSDGGRFEQFEDATRQAAVMLAEGADILDMGGESTRPRSETVPEAVEISRVMPVIEAVKAAHPAAVLSIDTRKASVASAALQAGAILINDVSALSYDPLMLEVIRDSTAPVCLMHALGDPKTMQDNPVYEDVLLDVYDYLENRLQWCERNGIARDRIVVDPGIGFGKKQYHNLALIRGLSLFHGLGCAVLLGVSRKRFIGTIGQEPQADRRAPGSIALALEAIRQGVQIVRVHDIAATRQAVALWQAAR